MSKPKMRFPDNVIVAASKKVESSDSTPRGLARARGATKGHEWICWLYGAGTYAPQVSFPFELPSGHKPTKSAFVRLLNQANLEFETQYKFDRSNGTFQVRNRDNHTNEAYGFWDALNNIAEEFDLWDVLNKEPDPKSQTEGWFDVIRGMRSGHSIPGNAEPSTISIGKTTRMHAGECNFCPSGDHEVYALSSSDPHKTLQVRLCRQCVLALKSQMKAIR